MEGVVVRSTGRWYTVKAGDGSLVECALKGRFRIKGIRTTNPVAVGDHVRFRLIPGKDTGLIETILPRRNYIIRRATRLSKAAHILAANIDQVVIVATLALPRTSAGFIDRVLVTAEAYHIPGIMIFNKADLFDDELEKQYMIYREVYGDAGYKVLKVSALKGINLEEVRSLWTGRRSLLVGHSGAGKSALINAVQPGLGLKTGPISDTHLKGKHTTTFAQLYDLDFGGEIIDTPGVKEFGLTDFDRNEVGERYPEMRSLLPQCRFNNCTHVHEPGCAVQKAVEEGSIALFRYNNYLSILSDDYWAEQTVN